MTKIRIFSYTNTLLQSLCLDFAKTILSSFLENWQNNLEVADSFCSLIRSHSLWDSSIFLRSTTYLCQVLNITITRRTCICYLFNVTENNFRSLTRTLPIERSIIRSSQLSISMQLEFFTTMLQKKNSIQTSKLEAIWVTFKPELLSKDSIWHI